jgi:hypothetical protein
MKNSVAIHGKISFFLFVCICVCLAVVSNIPWYQRSIVTPRYVSPYVHGSDIDYFTYLASIRESKDGAWVIPAQFTTESTQSSYIYVFYIIVGKIARIYNLSPIEAYHGSRIISVLFFICTLYLVTKELTNKGLACISALIGLFSTVPMHGFSLLFTSGLVHYPAIRDWWYNMDPLFRIDNVPHHHFATSICFVVIILIFQLMRKFSIWKFLLALFCSFFSTLIYPAPAFIFLVGISSSMVYWMIISVCIRKKEKFSMYYSTIFILIVIILASVIALLLLKIETLKGFPWNQWIVWDVLLWNRRYDMFVSFIIGSGIPFLVALPSMIRHFIAPKSFRDVFLSIWAVLPLVLFPLFLLIRIALIRIVFVASFVPVGILAVETIVDSTNYVKNRAMKYIIRVCILVLFIAVSAPTTIEFYQDKVKYYQFDAPHIRIQRNVFDALNFVSQSSLYHARFLSTGAVGLSLPSFGSVISYFGHPVHTQYYDVKIEQVILFYSGKLTSNQARMLLKKNHIEYIFVGPKEGAYGGSVEKYDLPLTIWYKNPEVILYKVDVDTL